MRRHLETHAADLFAVVEQVQVVAGCDVGLRERDVVRAAPRRRIQLDGLQKRCGLDDVGNFQRRAAVSPAEPAHDVIPGSPAPLELDSSHLGNDLEQDRFGKIRVGGAAQALVVAVQVLVHEHEPRGHVGIAAAVLPFPAAPQERAGHAARWTVAHVDLAAIAVTAFAAEEQDFEIGVGFHGACHVLDQTFVGQRRRRRVARPPEPHAGGIACRVGEIRVRRDTVGMHQRFQPDPGLPLVPRHATEELVQLVLRRIELARAELDRHHEQTETRVAVAPISVRSDQVECVRVLLAVHVEKRQPIAGLQIELVQAQGALVVGDGVVQHPTVERREILLLLVDTQHGPGARKRGVQRHGFEKLLGARSNVALLAQQDSEFGAEERVFRVLTNGFFQQLAGAVAASNRALGCKQARNVEENACVVAHVEARALHVFERSGGVAERQALEAVLQVQLALGHTGAAGGPGAPEHDDDQQQAAAHGGGAPLTASRSWSAAGCRT